MTAQTLLPFQIVVAASSNLGIGKNGKMPWKISSDLKYFKKLTSSTFEKSKRNAVIMGRKTWESIPAKFRPLEERLNIVLSKNNADRLLEIENSKSSLESSLKVFGGFDKALEYLSSDSVKNTIEKVFVIGGAQIYKEALSSPFCEVVHMTEIQETFDCDTFFEKLDPKVWHLWLSSETKYDENEKVHYTFSHYVRQTTKASSMPAGMTERHEEYQYLELIQDVISNGNLRGDRTGTGTYSKFGCQMRFNLRKNFPLLTTKRVFWRGVVEELLWFLRGDTNAKNLKDKDINIWNGNSSREYLDSVGLSHREENDLGPVYGFQWRHFGAQYKDMHADYTGQGVDQLASVIDLIKNNPNDRRILLTAWNPLALPEMALPPCHMFAQFYVANGELSCQMYQRSADLGLGVPFNIASYALLTCMLAKVTNLVPGEFVHVLGDAHVYVNHVDALREQLLNDPKPFPTLNIKGDKNIDEYEFDDFELVGYEPHKKIFMKMAV